MKNYELTLILKNDLTNEALNTLLQGISALIQEKGGLLEKQEIKGKREKGTLVALVFSLKPEEIENLQKKIKDEKGIVRFMIMVAPRHRAQTPALRTLGTEKSYPTETKEEETVKLTAEDIDKKLEEIFNGPQ